MTSLIDNREPDRCVGHQHGTRVGCQVPGGIWFQFPSLHLFFFLQTRTRQRMVDVYIVEEFFKHCLIQDLFHPTINIKFCLLTLHALFLTMIFIPSFIVHNTTLLGETCQHRQESCLHSMENIVDCLVIGPVPATIFQTQHTKVVSCGGK